MSKKDQPSDPRENDEMTTLNRRNLLKGAGAVGAMSATGLLDFAKAWAQTMKWKPEAMQP